MARVMTLTMIIFFMVGAIQIKISSAEEKKINFVGKIIEIKLTADEVKLLQKNPSNLTKLDIDPHRMQQPMMSIGADKFKMVEVSVQGIHMFVSKADYIIRLKIVKQADNFLTFQSIMK